MLTALLLLLSTICLNAQLADNVPRTARRGTHGAQSKVEHASTGSSHYAKVARWQRIRRTGACDPIYEACVEKYVDELVKPPVAKPVRAASAQSIFVSVAGVRVCNDQGGACVYASFSDDALDSTLGGDLSTVRSGGAAVLALLIASTMCGVVAALRISTYALTRARQHPIGGTTVEAGIVGRGTLAVIGCGAAQVLLTLVSACVFALIAGSWRDAVASVAASDGAFSASHTWIWGAGPMCCLVASALVAAISVALAIVQYFCVNERPTNWCLRRRSESGSVPERAPLAAFASTAPRIAASSGAAFVLVGIQTAALALVASSFASPW